MRSMVISYGQVNAMIFLFSRESMTMFLGPCEICIVQKSAISLIYGPQSECLKSTWYTQVDSDYRKCSVHMTHDFDDHRRRRKAWDRGLSIKGK